uniref:Uncharacterized protein n=1 Tax=Anguilla anguilla TaxID=7936 RepID=A0A0E9UTF8_ANGAN
MSTFRILRFLFPRFFNVVEAVRFTPHTLEMCKKYFHQQSQNCSCLKERGVSPKHLFS